MGLVQGYTAIQEIQEQAWRMGNHPAPGRSGSEGPDAGKERDCLQHSQTWEPEGSDKAVEWCCHRQEAMGKSWSQCLILDHLHSFTQAHFPNTLCWV